MIARLVEVIRRRPPFATVAVAATLGLAACSSGDDAASGGNGSADPVTNGRDVAEDRGCMSCHREGGGGIGPDWEGLAGSTVTLDDGSSVVADEEYLVRAITDPDAEVVDGYDIAMPTNDLSDAEVASILAYIQSLGIQSPGDSPEPTS